MASQGPFYPATITTEAGPSGDNDWLTASNVGADDGSEAQITHATFDANDHSFRLKAQNFGFTVTGTVVGITVEIEQRRFAGAAEDQEVRLYDAAGALAGDDKQTATAWPATATIATYGGVADTWNAGLTAADVNDPDFGVALIVLATAANTDIGVDFIRVTVEYTPPPAITGSGGVTFAAPSASATAKEAMTGSGGITITAPAAAVTSKETMTGSGGLTLAALAVAGTGTVTSTGVTGTGAIAFAAPAVAGTGKEAFTGTGAVAFAAPAVAASAKETFTGTGALAILAPTLDGTGLVLVPVTGTAAVTIAAPAVAATGSGGAEAEAEVVAGPVARGVAAVAAHATPPSHPPAVPRGRGPTYRPWIKRIEPVRTDDEDLLDKIIALLL